MSKPKLILGIAITILSGAIMLESMISGNFYFAGNLYEDFQTIDIEPQALQAPLKTPFFSVKEGQILSVWFRYTIWQIDNKNLEITVLLIDEDGNIIGELGKDFRFGYFRNRARKIKYYKLGEYHFRKDFRGYLQYELDGTWKPAKASALVLRKAAPVRLPLKQIGFFVVGLFALIVGIETVAKNYTKQLNYKQSDRFSK